jgi:hypothetical protein
MTIEGGVPSYPIDMLFKIYASIQKWRSRLGDAEAGELDALMIQAHGWTKSFPEERRSRPSEDPFS